MKNEMNENKTPETDALRDLYENHEHRANVGDIWDLCESLEHRLAEIKRLERERNETANTFMRQVKNLQAQLAITRNALDVLARLGNEPNFGYSDGNIIAFNALARTLPKP